VLQNQELARRLGAAGRANAEAHAWPRIARQLQDVLVSVLDG
jgi:glycosyltransferase involved in cell wall biosynthesis